MVSINCKSKTESQVKTQTHSHALALKGNKSHGYPPLHLLEVPKHNHLQLQLRISRQWFTGDTVLNTHHLNFLGHAIL